MRKEIEELLCEQILKLRDAGEQAISKHTQYTIMMAMLMNAIIKIRKWKKKIYINMMERTRLVGYYMYNLYAVTEHKNGGGGLT